VVQEPEIHLHPNAQASLASFFVSLFQQTGQLFIETHSDALVLRIARHVALKELNPKDVAVFFFTNTSEGKIVEQLTITDRGTFAPPWPGGFFPQREVETLGLARARNAKPKDAVAQQLEFKYPESE
jgi:predicted ATPase